MSATPTPNMQAPLAPLAGEPAPRPAWFDKALARQPERSFVEVHGTPIEVLAWGERGKPGLLLLHGNRAHADWWSFVAPYLADQHRVVAMSWSGMGGSGWRDAYSFPVLIDEVDAVAEASGLFDGPRKPVVVAHSFGAFVAVRYAADRGQRLGGVVTLDMPMHPRERNRDSERDGQDAGRAEGEKPPGRTGDANAPEGGGQSGKPRSAHTPLRDNAVYPTVAAALAKYRFAPLQPCENLFIADHIARLSLKPAAVEGQPEPGVTWRFDPFFWRSLRLGSPAQDMLAAKCPLAVMWGGDSVLIDQAMVGKVREKYPADMPWIEIPGAGHHVMVDQPLALVAGLRGLL